MPIGRALRPALFPFPVLPFTSQSLPAPTPVLGGSSVDADLPVATGDQRYQCPACHGLSPIKPFDKRVAEKRRRNGNGDEDYDSRDRIWSVAAKLCRRIRCRT